MATNTIDAGLLAKMFLAGAKNLEVKKEWINELNVFPVPDGDTGTNMTLTIMSAVKEVNSLTEVNMYNLSKAISSGSLRGARGNSGVILSQLLRGFTKKIRDYQELNAEILAEAMEKAVETAYKAVMKPKEAYHPDRGKGSSRESSRACTGKRRSERIHRGRSRACRVRALPDTRDAAGIKRGRRCGFRRTGSLNRTAGRI